VGKKRGRLDFKNEVATSSTVATDQRGFAITDGMPDIGATEFIPYASTADQKFYRLKAE